MNQKISKVVFYNCYHNGDIFVSRRFVEILTSYFIENGITDITYRHNNSNKTLKDLPIKIQTLEGFQLKETGQTWFVENETLYANTWYGCGKYFLGCTVQTLHAIFNGECKKFGIDIFDNKEATDFIPVIDYKKFDTKTCDDFLSTNTKKTIFISNGATMSGQAGGHYSVESLTSMICDAFPDILFIASNSDPQKSNCKLSSSIIKCKESDLIENSYLAKHCVAIIGRNSGSQTFCYNTDVVGKVPLLLVDNAFHGKAFGLIDCFPNIYHLYDSDKSLNDIFNWLKDRICTIV